MKTFKFTNETWKFWKKKSPKRPEKPTAGDFASDNQFKAAMKPYRRRLINYQKNKAIYNNELKSYKQFKENDKLIKALNILLQHGWTCVSPNNQFSFYGASDESQ